jgi:glycosyltransferase involved in cell wall biosynthesis
MRIGLVTGEYPPMEGGVGAFTEQLARALAMSGHEIHIITSNKARPAEIQRTLTAIKEPVDLGFARLHPRAGKWRWPDLTVIADIAIRYDLETVNIQYQAAAFNMRSPAINFLPWRLKGFTTTVVTFHDLRVPYLFPKAGGLRERVVRMLTRQADGCIATNPADDRRLHDWTDRPVRRIPIGSNIDAYDPNHIELAEVRERLDLKPGDILIGYFGFLSESKGADLLIDSLAMLDERYHLVFIGGQTGDSDQDNNQAFVHRLRAQIDHLNLNERVHWTGFLPSRRVSAHLAATDLMVMPYRDGVSLRRGTLMAVLAHGRPLVTTYPEEEIPELEHGENIWLLSPHDSPALAAGIAMLMADPEQRNRLRRGARELARQFSWDVIAAQTATFYEELVAAKTRGPLK